MLQNISNCKEEAICLMYYSHMTMKSAGPSQQTGSRSYCVQRWEKWARCTSNCHRRGRTAGSQGTGSCLNLSAPQWEMLRSMHFSISILNRFKFIILNVELHVRKDENVAFYGGQTLTLFSGSQAALCLLFGPVRHPAVYFSVLHGPWINEQPKLVPIVELCCVHDLGIATFYGNIVPENLLSLVPTL